MVRAARILPRLPLGSFRITALANLGRRCCRQVAQTAIGFVSSWGAIGRLASFRLATGRIFRVLQVGDDGLSRRGELGSLCARGWVPVEKGWLLLVTICQRADCA